MSALRSRVLGLVLIAALAGCERCSAQSSSSSATSSSVAPSAAPLASASSDPFASVRWDDTPIDWSRPAPVTPPGGLAEPGYVGSEACKGCHAKIYATYMRHSMARTGMRPLGSLDKKWLASIFDDGAKQPSRHARSGLSYLAYREGDRYFVEETMADATGARVHSWKQELTHALSAGSYGLAFYFRVGNRLYQAPVDYYAKIKRWDMDPGAVEGNPRFSKPLLASCIHCHGDYPRRRAGADDVFFDPMPAGVGCERCHGPGERHVKSVRRDDVVNPARLTTTRQLDVCAQCHQSSFTQLRADKTHYDYRPGEPLDAQRVSFLGDPPEADRVGLLAHSERMVRSACWRGSGGKLVCTSCHDAHVSSFDEPQSWWDKKCDSCHHDHGCTETKAARAARGDHCVYCHMRSGPPMNPSLVAITDHWIQRRPPPIRPGRDEKPAHLVTWSKQIGDPVSGDDLEAVTALAYSDAGQNDEAIRLAANAMDKWPHVPQLYEWLSGRFAQRRQPMQSARAHAAVLRFSPDARDSLVGYARSMFDVGSPNAIGEALHALDRLLAYDDDDPGALETKAIYLFRVGRVDDAAPLFEHAAAAGTTMGPSHVGLAVIAMRAGRRDEALSHLEAARRIEPADIWILDKLADAYVKANDTVRAGEVERARTFFVARDGRKQSGASLWLPPAWR